MKVTGVAHHPRRTVALSAGGVLTIGETYEVPDDEARELIDAGVAVLHAEPGDDGPKHSELRARAKQLGLSQGGTSDEIAARIAAHEKENAA